MTIVADRGLFVRLLVQSGKFEHAQAEALVDAIDATTKEPATKAELDVAVTEMRGDIKRLDQRVDQLEKRLEQQIASSANGLLVKLGGLMIALTGLLFAALRLT
jgi:uncharacterized protein YceH (UPF0502 family)